MAIDIEAPGSTDDDRLALGLQAYQPVARGLMGTLISQSQSIAIIVLGDSTGAATTRWPYLFLDQLRTELSGYRAVYAEFDDTSKDYPAWTVLQAGNEEYIDFTGAIARHMPVSETLAVTANAVVDVRVDMTATDWTPSASQRLARRGALTGTGSTSWMFSLSSTGVLNFLWTSDGATLANFQSTVATGFTDGTRHWVRAVFTPDTGAAAKSVAFYTSSDGVVWTQLGTTVSSAIAVTYYVVAGQGYHIGGDSGLNGLIGRIYDVEIRDGLAGQVLNPKPISTWRRLDTSFTTTVDGGGPCIYMLNGSMSGQGLAYFNTNYLKMLHNYMPSLVLISTSHNEGGMCGFELASTWDTLIANVISKLPNAQILGVLQNPETSPSPRYDSHNRRLNQLKGYFGRKGIGVINVYDDFLQSGVALATLVDPADGVHCLAAGQQRWWRRVFRSIVGRPPLV